MRDVALDFHWSRLFVHRNTTGDGAGVRGSINNDNNHNNNNNNDDNNEDRRHNEDSHEDDDDGESASEDRVLDSEEVRSEESVHFHDGVGVGKSICVGCDVLSVSGMSSLNVDREE